MADHWGGRKDRNHRDPDQEKHKRDRLDHRRQQEQEDLGRGRRKVEARAMARTAPGERGQGAHARSVRFNVSSCPLAICENI